MTATLAVPTGDLAAMPTAELKAELSRGLVLTAAVLARLGTVWAELVRRGEDLSDLRSGLARYLPRIASGQLAAEAVVEFANRPTVLQSIEGLPLPRQRELAAGGTVRVLSAGTPPVEMPLAAMPAALVRAVFAAGEERTPAEQQAAATKPRPGRDGGEAAYRYRVRVDRDTRTVRIGKMTVPVEDVLGAFAAAATGLSVLDRDLAATPGPGVRMASCYLTDDEAARLDAAAKAKGIDRAELVRRAVVAMLLL